jgi:hypothetical protein
VRDSTNTSIVSEYDLYFNTIVTSHTPLHQLTIPATDSLPFPGQTLTVVNDRLRRETEIYGDRKCLSCTVSVYRANDKKRIPYTEVVKKSGDFEHVALDAPYTK